MPSVFSRIINGELPGHIPFADDTCIVLMSINPIAPGHCLVIPRVEIDQWSDLESTTCTHLVTISQRLSKVLRNIFPCERVGLIIAGFEVPHCHLHVIPARSMADLDFTHAAVHVDHEELESQSALIASGLN
jgi:diadenosine tetraphosphate (Ap4A) HIT family hydrolase